jgi:hypothetical protein
MNAGGKDESWIPAFTGKTVKKGAFGTYQRLNQNLGLVRRS